MTKKAAKTGKELERRVANAYREMGARKVEHDVELAGNQIDVYVELETPDRSQHRIAVEAKDYTSPVGIDIVNGFALRVSLLRSKGLIDEGVIVSAAGFSRPARNAAREHGIRLLEPVDLDARIAQPEATPLPTPVYRDLQEHLGQAQGGEGAHAELPARLFIAYKRHNEPDQRLATYLHEVFTAQGHEVFIDLTMRTGAAWIEEIDRQIRASDFLIVLLSRESADSEMVQAEIRRAHEYRKRQGRPHILPVRVAYEGLLPYSVDAFLNPLRYVIWWSEADTERVGQELLAATRGQLSDRAPVVIEPPVAPLAFFEDGRVVEDPEALPPPLPEFDPRVLKSLAVPGGTVRLRDEFYIEREADADLRREIVEPGMMITIRASRQTGKSSLLVRGAHHARQLGARVVFLDMQLVDEKCLTSPDRFLRYLAEFIVRELCMDTREVERAWQSRMGAQIKLTYLMEDHVLPQVGTRIVLAMDEVDRLLETPFHSNFFALMRAWFNRGAYNPLWEKLTIVLVISTEPHLLIKHMNQSPFNVGLKLYLEDFNAAQVGELNRRHDTPVRESALPQFLDLLGGHPYLTRKALYTLVTKGWTWQRLVDVAASDYGPFGDHLRRYHWLLHDKPGLQEALQQVLREGCCSDDMAFFRLLRAGLVKGSGTVCQSRCGLYGLYFKEKFR